MGFEVERCLTDFGIGYKTRGTNIAEGWIGVHHCPFCGDTRYHGGIHLDTGAYSCWVCGHKGWMYAYLMAEMGWSRDQVHELCRPYFNDNISKSTIRRRANIPSNKKLEFPPSFTPVDALGMDYLCRRNFDPSVADRYHLKSVMVSDYKWNYRLIIPFYIDGILVGWTGRALVPELEPRYKNISNAESLVDMRSTLFNIDALQRKSILVEGPFDAMKVGGATAAVVGLEYTTSQVLMVKNRGVEECTVVFDGEEKAFRRANRLAAQLSSIGIRAYVIRLKEGQDPAELSDEEAYQLRQVAL